MNINQLIEQEIGKYYDQPIKIALNRPDMGDYKLFIRNGEDLVTDLEQSNLFEKVTYGSGFINLTINKSVFSYLIQNFSFDIFTNTPKKILVDFSSPNIAKQMHVGHLRSTIIGESICRLYEKIGHSVMRINHIGDWGTSFGMLINLIMLKNIDITNYDLTSLQELYKESKKLFDDDPEFKQQSLQQVVKLQNGELIQTNIWKLICCVSKKEYDQIYQLLNIKIVDRGESFYQPYMTELCSKYQNIMTVDGENRTVLFVNGFKVPLIMIKSDGGFTYDTSDLTAALYRIEQDKVDEIVYVVDSGQSLHLQTVFAAVKEYFQKDNKLTHADFGLVCGTDGKKMKSRAGQSVKLIELINEAIEKTKQVYIQHVTKNEGQYIDGLNDNLFKILAMSSIKYADLKNQRTKNYQFSFEKMLSFDGDTAIYIIYTYTRLAGILRKIDDPNIDLAKFNINLSDSSEINLAKHILQYHEIINQYEQTLLPNKLCNYLYELANLTNKFYIACHIIDKLDGTVNYSRLLFVNKLMKLFETCFEIIGMEYVDTI